MFDDYLPLKYLSKSSVCLKVSSLHIFPSLCAVFWPSSYDHKSHISQCERVRTGASKAEKREGLSDPEETQARRWKGERGRPIVTDNVCPNIHYMFLLPLSPLPLDRSTWVIFKLNGVCRYAWVREAAWGRERESNVCLVKSLLKFLLHYTGKFPPIYAQVTLRHKAYVYECAVSFDSLWEHWETAKVLLLTIRHSSSYKVCSNMSGCKSAFMFGCDDVAEATLSHQQAPSPKCKLTSTTNTPGELGLLVCPRTFLIPVES